VVNVALPGIGTFIGVILGAVLGNVLGGGDEGYGDYSAAISLGGTYFYDGGGSINNWDFRQSPYDMRLSQS